MFARPRRPIPFQFFTVGQWPTWATGQHVCQMSRRKIPTNRHRLRTGIWDGQYVSCMNSFRGFKAQRDPLPAADAHRDYTTVNAVASHRMQ